MSNTRNTDAAVRCPECGFLLSGGLGCCPSCGDRQSHCSPAVLNWDAQIAGQHSQPQLGSILESPIVAKADDLRAAAPARGLGRLASPNTWLEPHPESEDRDRPAQNVVTSEGAQVLGRVIAIDNSQREPPDLDVCRLLTKILWGVLFLLAPLAVFGHTLITLGPALTVASVAGVLFLVRLLPMSNLIWYAYFTHANRRSDEQVPVWYARVRDTRDESEVMVRLKGLFSRGNVAADDLVSFWGSWRDGVLMAQHGFNHRTGTTIQFRQSNWWFWLALTLVLAAGMAWHLHDMWVSLNEIAG